MWRPGDEVLRPRRKRGYGHREAGVPRGWRRGAITIRIPKNLRDVGKEAAALKGISFSAFIRMCMIEELGKRG